MHRTRIHDERSRREGATSRCAPPPPRFALLPPLPCPCQAAVDIVLSRFVVCCKSNDDTTKARRYRFLKQREERKTYPLPGTKEFPNSSGRQG